MVATPISIIIDDPAPAVSVYYAHRSSDYTGDGRPILEYVSNDFLKMFCDIIEQYGIRGKFSVVPMPGNRGDIVNGIPGVPYEQIAAWIDIVKRRVMPHFAIGPEMLTHHKAVDLKTGAALAVDERVWSRTQDRSTLIPYISKALSLLREVSIEACGVTSPWDFGIEVEDEYAAAISQAVRDVNGYDTAWYFLRSLRNRVNAKPWVAYDEGGRCVVSIPATTDDHYWQTINTAETSDASISKIVDALITADGSSGEIIEVLRTNGWPIILTHWQSLVSNGLGTGLRALAETARRIEKNLAGQVEWKSFLEIMDLVAADKNRYPKPVW